MEYSKKHFVILLILAFVVGILIYYVARFYLSKTSPKDQAETDIITRLTAPATALPTITPQLRSVLTAPKP